MSPATSPEDAIRRIEAAQRPVELFYARPAAVIYKELLTLVHPDRFPAGAQRNRAAEAAGKLAKLYSQVSGKAVSPRGEAPLRERENPRMSWSAFVRDLGENLDMTVSISRMRVRRLLDRNARRMLLACVLMATFYLGRWSAGHWWDAIVVAVWLINVAFWSWDVRRAIKREDAEVNEVMNQTRAEILKRTGGSR